jgi:hypothetical protein
MDLRCNFLVNDFLPSQKHDDGEVEKLPGHPCPRQNYSMKNESMNSFTIRSSNLLRQEHSVTIALLNDLSSCQKE